MEPLLPPSDSCGTFWFGRKTVVVVSMGLSTLLFAGCARWGGRVLEASHVAFNTSVAQAMERQLILNLVRLNFDEPTQWMTVSSINLNAGVSSSASTGSIIRQRGNDDQTGGASLGFTYTPNITLIPRSNESISREAIAPIPIQTIEGMCSAGWPLSWLLFMTCESVQDIGSFDVTKSFGTVIRDPRLGRLLQLADDLEKHQRISLSRLQVLVDYPGTISSNKVDLKAIIDARREGGRLVRRPDGDFNFSVLETVPVLSIYPNAIGYGPAKEFTELLGIPLAATNYPLVATNNSLERNSISIRTRSLDAVMRLLSFGVDRTIDAPPPQIHLDSQDEVYRSLVEGTMRQDLRDEVRALFRIHWTRKRPKNDDFMVQYRGGYFWIDPKDQSSMQVFSLVRYIISLQISDRESAKPVLTIPVGH
jgi:hypothetical protein